VGPEQRAWFLRLEQEHEKLRAALRWLWEHGENEAALRLGAALGYFWVVRGNLREGVQALERALARVPHADPRLRARVLNRLGSLLVSQGVAECSRSVLEEALELGRVLDDAGMSGCSSGRACEYRMVGEGSAAGDDFTSRSGACPAG
jgi:uncharacterized protein HemY